MSERDRPTAAEIEQALRRGPGHARDLAGTGPGASAAASNEAPTDTAADAAMAAQRLSDRLAERGLADISYAPVDSPFGELLLAASDRGLLGWPFRRRTRTRCSSASRARVSPRIVQAPAQLDPIRRELDEYFAGRRQSFELALDWTLVGPFSRRVLAAASQIPYGDVLSYTESPPRRAARAARARQATRSAPTRSRSSSPATACCAAAARSAATPAGSSASSFLLELEGAL